MKINLTKVENQNLLNYLEKYRLEFGEKWLEEIPAKHKRLLKSFYDGGADAFPEIVAELKLDVNYEAYNKKISPYLISNSGKASKIFGEFHQFLKYKIIFG